jgi:hypothetical protein
MLLFYPTCPPTSSCLLLVSNIVNRLRLERREQPGQPVGGKKEHSLLESQLDIVTFESTAVCIRIK